MQEQLFSRLTTPSVTLINSTKYCGSLTSKDFDPRISNPAPNLITPSLLSSLPCYNLKATVSKPKTSETGLGKTCYYFYSLRIEM